MLYAILVTGSFNAEAGSSLDLDVGFVNSIATTNYEILQAGALGGTGLADFISTVNLTNQNAGFIYDFAQNTNDLILTIFVAPVGGIDLSDLTFGYDYKSDIRYDGVALNDDVNGDLVVDGLDIIYNELTLYQAISIYYI